MIALTPCPYQSTANAPLPETRLLMPRDNDKNNDSRGRRDRSPPGKGRSGAARGPDKKFAKRGFAGKGYGEKRSFAGKSPIRSPANPMPQREGPPPRRDETSACWPAIGPIPIRPQRFNRDDRPVPMAAKSVPIPRVATVRITIVTIVRRAPIPARPGHFPTGSSATRSLMRRAKAGLRNGPTRRVTAAAKNDPIRRAARAFARTATGRAVTVPRAIVRLAHGHRATATARKENSAARGNLVAARPTGARARNFGDRPDAGQIAASQNPGRSATPVRLTTPAAIPARRAKGQGILKSAISTSRVSTSLVTTSRAKSGAAAERPRFSRPREDRPQGERPQGDRPFRARPNFDRPDRNERPRGDRPQGDRPRFDRPRQDRRQSESRGERSEGARSWQEHPRSEARSFDRNADRPRRDNEDDSKVFAKRPAFGGRGAYRERKPDFEKRAARPPREKKTGERIAKVVSRAGLASRRDAEEWIVQGRVTVNGRLINSPALDVTANDVITVDGKPLPPRERTGCFCFTSRAA